MQAAQEGSDSPEDSLHSVCSHKSKGTSPIVVKAEVDGKLVPWKPVKGCKVNIVYPGQKVDN